MAGWPHAAFPTGAFGGAPYGATKRVRNVPQWRGGRMRPFPLEPLVELLMGPRNAGGVCRNGGVAAYELSHWSPRWGSLWGHETSEGCAEMTGWPHTSFPTGAFGAAPYGATKRVRGVPQWRGGRI